MSADDFCSKRPADFKAIQKIADTYDKAGKPDHPITVFAHVYAFCKRFHWTTVGQHRIEGGARMRPRAKKRPPDVVLDAVQG